MGPSLHRNVFRYASSGFPGSALPQGQRRFSPLAVSLTPRGLVVKMPRGGPAGWRSVEVVMRRVTNRTIIPVTDRYPLGVAMRSRSAR